MGGKRSKLKHARKHHTGTSKPGLNRSTTAAGPGTKRPIESPANRTRIRPAKRTKEDWHKQGGDKGKEVVSTAKPGQASVSSSSSDLEDMPSSTSMMGGQQDSVDLSQVQGDAYNFDSRRLERLQETHRAVKKLEASLECKPARGPQEVHKAAVSLDLQAIELPG